MALSGLNLFLKTTRAKFSFSGISARNVHISEVSKSAGGKTLADYIADKTPLFYRDLPKIIDDLGDGYFVTTIKSTLAKLPTSESFQESHFGEIATGIFVEEVMGLRKLYSKLTLLTAENANAFKMDLVLYRPTSDPIEFIFGEVKSSPKISADGSPVGHHKSCFADIFTSMNKYGDDDLAFDLTAAKDHIQALPEVERNRIRKALMPYGDLIVSYAGFAIIDTTTKSDSEISLLATRQNKKTFDVDVICVEEFPTVATSAYKRLEALRRACSE